MKLHCAGLALLVQGGNVLNGHYAPSSRQGEQDWPEDELGESNIKDLADIQVCWKGGGQKGGWAQLGVHGCVWCVGMFSCKEFSACQGCVAGWCVLCMSVICGWMRTVKDVAHSQGCCLATPEHMKSIFHSPIYVLAPAGRC
jgi:hypothetical protein